MPTTAQHVNTLLHHLHTKQQPPFSMLFWSAIQKIDFDYSSASIDKISQLFAQLGKRDISVAKIVSQQGGDNFLLAIASYIAKTLSVTTGERVTWYNYDEISQDIAEQNRLHNTHFALPKAFGSSLVAKVGNVYCQPLKLVPSLLAGEKGANGESILAEFLNEMTQAVFADSQVNLIDDANSIAKHYLAKIQTGKLLDKSIGFYAYLAEIDFDFSQNSLIAVDKALAIIAQHENFSQADYARIISEPANQACIFLLGFYIGAASSQLANVASKWADYDEMSAMLGADFINCIEQRFVQLMENHYRTPMLVVTNRLFGIAPNFPKSAVEFAKLIDEQNRGELHIFLAKALQHQQFDTPLPSLYQQAIHIASQLLTSQLKQVIEQKPLVPKLIQADSQSQQTATLSSMDNDTALDKLYRQLSAQDTSLLYQVASFGLLTNLPLGQFDAIALEIRIHKTADTEPMALQLLLPYRIDNDEKLPVQAKLVLYPLISNQPNLPKNAYALVKALYAQLPAKIWQACAVQDLTPWAKSPLQQATADKREQANHQHVSQIGITLLPFIEHSSETAPTVGLDLALPQFDYEQINWRGYDLPKYILDTPESQREYLQVLVPERLIGDELFSQAENVQRLYRYGKVVWGVVINHHVQNNPLYDYDASVTDMPPKSSQEQVLTVDIVYDPTGQASVAELQKASEQLQAVLEQPIDRLPPDQSMYAIHANDERSRLFALDYPQSLAKNSLKISSSWLWRLHLPNGMLAKNAPNVVPIIIEPETPNQPMNAKGRVMILPSRFWSPMLYQNWLITARSPSLTDGGDLMPKITWQEGQGYRYVGKGLDARLFPKFKFDPDKAKPAVNVVNQTNQTNPLPQLTTQKPIAHASPMLVSTQPTASPIDTLAPSRPPLAQSAVTSNQPMPINNPQPTAKADKFAGLSPELQQQLLREQARLQSELSTSDSQKERKLYIIIGVVVALVILAMLIASLMGK